MYAQLLNPDKPAFYSNYKHNQKEVIDSITSPYLAEMGAESLEELKGYIEAAIMNSGLYVVPALETEDHWDEYISNPLEYVLIK